MGDISIIARRMKDGHIQYGWSGNGGYFRSVGVKLLAWYDTYEYTLKNMRRKETPRIETIDW